MNLAASSQNNNWGAFLLVGGLLILFHWIAMGSHKADIRREVSRLKARLVNIHWLPFYGGGDRNDTFYEVVMVLPSGRRVSAVCKCNVFHGVYWKSTPWSQELIREPAVSDAPQPEHSRGIIADCHRCGYGIRKGWIACPNCGSEVEG